MTAPRPAATTGQQLLLSEFTEAWAHYRHLESARQTYMNMYFGLLIAIAGFLATLAPQINLTSPLALAGVAGGTWALSIVSTMIFANIRKLGLVLKHHEGVMGFVRRQSYGEDYFNEFKVLDVRNTTDPIMTMRAYRLQSVSEWILSGMALVFAMTLGAIVVLNPTGGIIPRLLLLLAAATSTAFILFMLVAPAVIRRRMTSGQPLTTGSNGRQE